MGRFVYSLNLRMEIESPKIKDGESGGMLSIPSEILYNTVVGLRSELISEFEDMSAKDFKETCTKACEVNTILGQLEDIEAQVNPEE